MLAVVLKCGAEPKATMQQDQSVPCNFKACLS